MNRKIEKRMIAPGGQDIDRCWARRIAGRLGLDFLVAGLKYVNRQFGR